MAPAPPAARRAEQLRLALRADLKCWLQGSGDEAYYVIEDPINSRFFRLGTREWTFVSFLDGHNTVAEAVRLAAESGATRPVTLPEAARLCRWLLESQLANCPEERRATAEPSPATAGRRRSRFDLLWMQLPLVNPDAALGWLAARGRFLFSLQALGLWITLLGTGGYEVASRWAAFCQQTADLVSPGQWLTLLAVWLGLKLLHEAAHGVACKHYGGSVPAAGLTLRLFSPLAFVDLTDAWRIRSRWQRFVTSAAGMQVELAVAGVAAIAWGATREGLAHTLAHRVVLAAGVSTLAFNLNPLMRFDGYYMLADAAGLTNLYARGQLYCDYLIRRWGLGMAAARPAQCASLAVRLYGVLAWAWRGALSISLAVAATTWFGGLGLIVSVAIFGGWLLAPLVRYTLAVVAAVRTDARALAPLAVRAIAVAAVAATATVVPWPGGRAAPGFIEYAPLTVVRTDAAGFVRRVFVAAGDTVRGGEPLCEVVDDESAVELADVELELRLSDLKRRAWRQEDEPGKCQAEAKRRESLETRRAELQRRQAAAIVRAPGDGRVVSPHVDALVGRYLAAGAEVLRLGDEGRKEAVLLLDQADAAALKDQRDVPWRLAIGRRTLSVAGTLDLSPSASDALENEALGAHCGGPLDVRPVHAGDQVGPRYALVAPRFTARLPIGGELGPRLAAGVRVAARAGGPAESIAEHLGAAIDAWLSRKLKR